MAVSVSASESIRSVLKDDSSSNIGKEEYRVIHLAGHGKEIPTDQIYKKSMLSRLRFPCNNKVKSVKNTFYFKRKQQDLYLLTRDDIRMHMSKYEYLHIGLVQVHVEPSLSFDRQNDKRILVFLRDAKHMDLKDSIIAAFEIDLGDGGTKFNWFPNYSASLSDLSTTNGLVITVEPYALKDGDDTMFQISYRMCYKLMKGSLEPRLQFENPVLEVKTERANVLAPRTIGRNQMERTGLELSVSEQ